MKNDLIFYTGTMRSFLLIFLALIPIMLKAQDMPTSSPKIKTFFLNDVTQGQIDKSVNLYTGNVNLPVNLISLPGRGGLNAGVSLSYSTPPEKFIDTWNLDAPTGVLGLGWSIDIPRIVVDNKMTGARDDDEFYLVDGGASVRLICTSINGDGTRTYKSERYEPWIIKFYEYYERWEITKEDGFKYTYGDKNLNSGYAVEYVIHWGSWIGSSSYHTVSNDRQGIVWKLAKIENRFGDNVNFKYNNVERFIKYGAGNRHTESSYLESIADPVGRKIEFIYALKEPREYQDPHTEVNESDSDAASGDAYQERYEKNYLSNIEIKDIDGSKLYTFQFIYDLPQDGNLTKRLLKSIIQKNSAGKSFPSLDFSYKSSGIKKGALEKVTYPQGGEVIYHYNESGININNSDRELTISAPVGDYAEPYLWYGEDYVVVTWREQGSDGSHLTDPSTVKLYVYQWDGEWKDTGIRSEFYNIRSGIIENLSNMEEFQVVTEKDFFAVLYNTSSSLHKNYQLLLYKKDKSKRCTWDHEYASPFYSLNDYEIPQLLSGDRFVAVAPQRKDKIETYLLVGDEWRHVQIDRGNNSWYKATTSNNFIISNDTDLDYFKLYYLDETLEWQTKDPGSSNYFNTNFDVEWYSSNSIALAIGDGNEYLFTWDENYNFKPKVSLGMFNDLKSEVFIVNNSLVGILDTDGSAKLKIARYDGYNWYITPDLTYYHYAHNSFGDDFGIRYQGGSSTNKQYKRRQFDPNTLSWSSDIIYNYNHSGTNIFGDAVEAGNNYFSLWNQIYYRSHDGNWDNAYTISTDADEIYYSSVSYGYPNFLVKEYKNGGTYGAGTDIYFLRNGSVEQTKRISGVYAVRRNTYINNHVIKNIGPYTLVTCSSSYAANFLNATSLTLHRIVDEDIEGLQTDYPVSYIEINDRNNPPRYICFDYETSSALVDPSGQSVLYNGVKVINGSNNVANKPFGYTEYRFFNGSASNIPSIHGSGNEGSNYQFLKSIPYYTYVYDASGNLVSHSKLDLNVEFNDIQNATSHKVGRSFYVNKLMEENKLDNVTSIKSYDYNNALNPKLVTSESNTSSEGHTRQTDYKYLHELGGSFNYAISENLLGQVVQSKSIIDGSVLQATSIKWSIGETVDYPKETYRWKRSGNSDFNFTTSNPDWELISTTIIDEYGNEIQRDDTKIGISATTVLGYDNILPIAKVINASKDEVIVDVFEDINLSKWTTGDNGNDNDTQWQVENERLKLTFYSSATSGECDKIYSELSNEVRENVVLEFDVTIAESNNWDLAIGMGGDVWTEVNGGTENAIWTAINNESWRYYDGAWKTIKSGLIVGETYSFKIVYKYSENKADYYIDGIKYIDGGAFRMATSGIKSVAFFNYGYSSYNSVWYIDNMRLFPERASISLTSYDPIVGKTLEIDKNNKRVLYEYDEFDHLLTTRDGDNNILSHSNLVLNLKGEEEPQPAFLNINSPTSPLNVSRYSNSYNVDISSNVNWNASISSGDEDWLSTSQISGSNSGTIQLYIEQNNATSSRNGSLIIAGEGLNSTIQINQAAAPNSISVSPNPLMFYSPGTQTITVTSTVSWQTTINKSGNIDLYFPVTSGTGNATLNITCYDTSEYGSSAEIVFYNSTYGLSTSLWVVWLGN
jgi:hypothetical protein